MRPKPGTYPEYFANYIPLIKNNDVNEALRENWEEISSVLSHVPGQKGDYSYAPGKWTLKQVIQHLCDTERVITYRALRFARKDPQEPLPFDENGYAAEAELDFRSVESMLHEYETVRKATLSLFGNFSESVLLQQGNTSYGSTTVVALGYLIAGHALHHLNVLRQRYL